MRHAQRPTNGPLKAIREWLYPVLGLAVAATMIVSAITFFGQRELSSEPPPVTNPTASPLPPSSAATDNSPGVTPEQRPSPTPKNDKDKRDDQGERRGKGGKKKDKAGENTRPAPPKPQMTCVRPPVTETLNVISFNIHSGYGAYGLAMDRIAAAIKSWDADIVLLQEVDRFRAHSRGIDMPSMLGTSLGMYSAFGLNVQQGQGQYGVATLSKYPIVEAYNVHLPNAAGGQQRGLLRTDVEIGGVVVSLYNTHLQNEMAALRVSQAGAVAGQISANKNPSLLGGDFNAWPATPEISAIKTALIDTWAQIGVGTGATHPARSPRGRIDYLFHSPHFTPTSAAVYPTDLSDHAAVRATYQLQVLGKEVCVPVMPKPTPAATATTSATERRPNAS